MSPKTILVVEDEIGVQEVLVLALEGAGYRVATAGDGREGLKKVKEMKPDLVVTDFMMPRMSGPEMMRVLRANGDANIPAILVSAVPDAALTQGPGLFDAVLRKPFRLEELAATVERVLGTGA